MGYLTYVQNHTVLSATAWLVVSPPSLGWHFELLTHVPGTAGCVAPLGPMASFCSQATSAKHVCCHYWGCHLTSGTLPSTRHYILTDALGPTRHQRCVLHSTSWYMKTKVVQLVLQPAPKFQNNSFLSASCLWLLCSSLCLLLGLHLKMSR